jgi:hypothetical protein
LIAEYPIAEGKRQSPIISDIINDIGYPTDNFLMMKAEARTPRTAGSPETEGVLA